MAGSTPVYATIDPGPVESPASRQHTQQEKLLAHTHLLVGLCLTGGLLLMALASLFYTPQDPLAMSIGDRLQGPSSAHWLGTDQFGRDVLSRIMLGAVISMSVGVIAVGIGLVVGVLLGMLSGYFGRGLDEVLMRFMDALYGFPAILLALLMTAVLGPGVFISMVAIGMVNIPVFARLTRAHFLALRERDFSSPLLVPWGPATPKSSATIFCPTSCRPCSCR